MNTFRKHVEDHHTNADHQQMYTEHGVVPPERHGRSIFKAAMEMGANQRERFLKKNRKEAQRLHEKRELADHGAQLALNEMHTEAANSKGVDAGVRLKHQEMAFKAREKALQIATRQKQVHGKALETHKKKIEDLTRSLENAKTNDEKKKLQLKIEKQTARKEYHESMIGSYDGKQPKSDPEPTLPPHEHTLHTTETAQEMLRHVTEEEDRANEASRTVDGLVQGNTSASGDGSG
jgi:hypothetical protein